MRSDSGWCAYQKVRMVISYQRHHPLAICQRVVGVKIAALMALRNGIEWAQ